MRRRDFLRAVGWGAAVAAAPGALRAQGRRKPNVILIMADDMGYGDASCFGGMAFRTPRIDALAKGGMRFTDYHSNGAVCSPTRAALLTGRYQQRSGIEGVVTAKGHRDKGLALTETTFAEVLKAAGYTTAIFGKWHLGYAVEFNPAKQGFDEFVGYVSGNVDYFSHFDQVGEEDWWKNLKLTPEKGYVTDLITKHGVDFIERHKDRPFCLYLPHECPHYPYQGRGDKPERLPGKVKATTGARQDKAAAYQEMMQAMDEGVGRVVDAVKRLGLERDTFVFFCSDNGATGPGSCGPLRGKKGTLWEGGHRVPAVAYWPGKIEAGSETAETAIGMDLLPTMAAVAGAQLPPGLKPDGVDLSPVLFEGKALPARTLFWRAGAQRALRKGPWKLLLNPMGSKQPKKQQQAPAEGGSKIMLDLHLYNLKDDLGEQNNLAAQERGRAEKLLEELMAWDKEVSAGVERQT